jgi:hypothetical protein
MSLNFCGMPIGSALAGPVLTVSLTAGIVGSAVLALVAGVCVMLKIPAVESLPASPHLP